MYVGERLCSSLIRVYMNRVEWESYQKQSVMVMVVVVVVDQNAES